jgi:vacuolar-type H+-ATPase subunit C/Vma6
MNLLRSHEGDGYPTEYLIARIRGRRAYLVKDWHNFLFNPDAPDAFLPVYYRELMAEYSGEGVWKRMLKEYRWIYFQMNSSLRNVFLPFFMYSEVKTIILCLRYKAGKESRSDVEGLLSYSLLAGKVKELLMKEAELPVIIEELEKKFLSLKAKSRSMEETFSEEGLKGVEEDLSNGFMEDMIRSKLHPVIKSFFAFLTDTKNIMFLYKHSRWEIKSEPAFLNGGNIDSESLKRTSKGGSISGILRLIYQLTGVRITEPRITDIQNALNTGMTKHIKGMSREDPDIGLVLDYLWKTYMEARNLSILFYGRDIEREYIKKELVI